MKKKDLIFYAGAAVLMAVSAQGVSADELVSNEAATTEGNQVQAEKAPEVVVAEKSVAPVASNYVAPANVTEQPAAPASKIVASESGTPSVEKTTEASTTEKEETPLPSDTGSTTFFNAGAHAPAGRSTDVAVQPKSFVDVSSHNGEISIGDYRALANKGVGGVVVKLTEDTCTRTRMRRTKFAMRKQQVCKYLPTTSLAILLKKQRVQKHGFILQRRNA